MRAQACEIQLDKTKLIVYCEMSKWACFNDFVKKLARAAEAELRVPVRIFVQRKCTFSPDSAPPPAILTCASALLCSCGAPRARARRACWVAAVTARSTQERREQERWKGESE